MDFDRPTSASEAPLQKPECTIKRHFLGLARMLEKGHPLPIQTDRNFKIIICPIPSGRASQQLRSIIQPYLDKFPQFMLCAGHGAWITLRIMSTEKKHWIIELKDWLVGEQVQVEFSIFMYRSDAFSNGDDEAIDYAFSSQTTLQSPQYSDDELSVEEK